MNLNCNVTEITLWIKFISVPNFDTLAPSAVEGAIQTFAVVVYSIHQYYCFSPHTNKQVGKMFVSI